jgi:hypothetical protein
VNARAGPADRSSASYSVLPGGRLAHPGVLSGRQRERTTSVPHLNQDRRIGAAYLRSLKGPNDASAEGSLSYPLLDREEFTKDYSTADALLNYPLQQRPRFLNGEEPVMVNCGREPAQNHELERILTDVSKRIE